METNMELLEGVQRRLRVRLVSETGEVLPPGNFRVYGGAFCPGCAPAHFAAERTEEEWVLTMPGLKPGRVPWCWQVLAAEYATGVEWVLAGGEVTVLPRVASGAGGVDPGELELLAALDKTTMEMSVTVGESTAACSMAAGDARAYAIAADGSAKLAADSARLAQAARAGAETARDGAQVAQAGAEMARDGAQVAQAGAETARGDAQVAQAGAEMARDGARVAQAGAEMARGDAQVAQAGAEMARDGAQAAKADAVLAKDGAEAARDGAQAAKDDAVLAKDGAQVAQAGAEKAREGAQVAQAGAEKAREGAQAAKDEAVLAAAEAKAAEAGAAGAADAVRFDLLPLTLEWLDSRFNKTLGEGKFTMTYTEEENMLRVAFALETTEAQIAESRALLDRVLPRNLVKEMEWADGLPMIYKRLAYIESTGINGNGQYILTDVKPTPDTWIDCNMCPGPMQSEHVNYGFAATTNAYRSFQLLISGNGKIGGSFYWPPTGSTVKVLLNPEWGVMGNFRLKDKNVYVNGVYGGTCNDTPWEATSVLGLGGISGIQRSNTMFGTFKMGVGEELQVNLIPALDQVTKQPGMYDTVNKVFKTNAGVGDFTYPGKEMEATTYSLRNRMYGKITEHGVRRLYCVPEGYNSKEEYAAEHGFKLLVETQQPEEGYWQPVWRDREDCIELEWEEVSD